jgi:secreted trypsin-like serine protease
MVTTTDSIANLTTTYECNIDKVSCGCSIENVVLSTMRIIGGEEAVPHSWAMAVPILLNDLATYSCGGSILTESHILTSAHCIDGKSLIEMFIVAGIHDQIQDFPVIRYVHDIYIHPNWNGSDGTYRNDIAVLRIFPPLPIDGNFYLARTCVPYISSLNEAVNYPSNGSHLAIIGWGSTQYGNDTISNTLQQASLYMVDNNDPICVESIYDVEKQFCAGMQGRGKEKYLYSCF